MKYFGSINVLLLWQFFGIMLYCEALLVKLYWIWVSRSIILPLFDGFNFSIFIILFLLLVFVEIIPIVTTNNNEIYYGNSYIEIRQANLYHVIRIFEVIYFHCWNDRGNKTQQMLHFQVKNSWTHLQRKINWCYLWPTWLNAKKC